MQKKTKIILILSSLLLLAYFFNNCQDQSILRSNRGSSEQSSEIEDDICEEWDTEIVCRIKRENEEQNQQTELLELKLKTTSPIRSTVNSDFTLNNLEHFEFNVSGTCNTGGFFNHIILWTIHLVKPPENNQDPVVVPLCRSAGHKESTNQPDFCVANEAERFENYCENGKFFLRIRAPQAHIITKLNCGNNQSISACFHDPNDPDDSGDYVHLEVQLQLIAFTRNLEQITHSVKTQKFLSIEIREELEE